MFRIQRVLTPEEFVVERLKHKRVNALLTQMIDSVWGTKYIMGRNVVLKSICDLSVVCLQMLS